MFQDIVLNSGEGFDLNDYWNDCEPRTPPYMGIKMQEFDLNSLRDAVILNICNQKLHILPALTSSLLSYLDQSFEDLTQKVNLQILLHYSKMDVEILYKRYSAFHEMRSTSEAKLTRSEFYCQEITSYLCCAMETPFIENTVSLMSTGLKDYVIQCLLSTPMVTAFKKGLSMLLESDSICESKLVEDISNMQVYCVKQCGPLSSLRGACLTNGILICEYSLAASLGADTNKADLITLAAHETSHYLARLQMKNFNFSSPFQLGDKSREDSGSPRCSLEMGRQVELLLFGNVQPDWSKSSSLAAITFLERLFSAEDLPVIKFSEHKKLKLIERLLPSAPFGIDLEDKNLFFC